MKIVLVIIAACISISAPLYAQESFSRSKKLYTDTSIYQLDPRLSDLFDSDGVSQLCAPITASNIARWIRKSDSRIVLVDRDLDRNGTIDRFDLVRKMYRLCESDRDGTDPDALGKCMSKLFRKYPGRTSVWTFDEDVLIDQPHSVIPWLMRELDAGRYIILPFEWASTNREDIFAGHMVSVVGYQWKKTWGTRRLRLLIVDPMHDYGAEGYPRGEQYDLVDLIQYKYDGVIFHEIINKNWSIKKLPPHNFLKYNLRSFGRKPSPGSL